VASYEIQLNAKGTITGLCVVQNLPFTVKTGGTTTHSGTVRFANMATNWIAINAYPSPGTSLAYLQGSAAAGASNANSLVTADISNTTLINGTLVYFTA
jgi:hypothetical protein